MNMNEVPKRGRAASSIAMADEAAVGEPPYWNNMVGGMEAYHAFLRETLEAELAGSDRECAGPRASFWKGVGSFFFKRKKKSRRRRRTAASVLDLDPNVIRSLENHFQFLARISKTEAARKLSPERVQQLQAAFETRLTFAGEVGTPPSSMVRLNHVLETGKEMPWPRPASPEEDRCDCDFQALDEGALRLRTPQLDPDEPSSQARGTLVIIDDYLGGELEGETEAVEIPKAPVLPVADECPPPGLSPCSLQVDNPVVLTLAPGSGGSSTAVWSASEASSWLSDLSADSDSFATTFTSPESIRRWCGPRIMAAATPYYSPGPPSEAKDRPEEPGSDAAAAAAGGESSQDSTTTAVASPASFIYSQLRTPSLATWHDTPSITSVSVTRALYAKFNMTSDGEAGTEKAEKAAKASAAVVGGREEEDGTSAPDCTASAAPSDRSKPVVVTKLSPDSVLDDWTSPAPSTSAPSGGKIKAAQKLNDLLAESATEASRKFSEAYKMHKMQLLPTLLKKGVLASLPPNLIATRPGGGANRGEGLAGKPGKELAVEAAISLKGCEFVPALASFGAPLDPETDLPVSFPASRSVLKPSAALGDDYQ